MSVRRMMMRRFLYCAQRLFRHSQSRSATLTGMNEVLQTNIFFVITSIAVVALTILLCFVLYQILGILKNVRDITERIRRGSEQLAEDAQVVRSFVHDGIIGTARKFLSGLGNGEKRSSRRGKKEDRLPEEDLG
jgi:hypothetical protein